MAHEIHLKKIPLSPTGNSHATYLENLVTWNNPFLTRLANRGVPAGGYDGKNPELGARRLHIYSI